MIMPFRYVIVKPIGKKEDGEICLRRQEVLRCKIRLGGSSAIIK